LFADELAQESFGRLLVATALNQRVKDETILINGAPKPMLGAIDGDDDFIDMPFVAELRCAPPAFSHSSALPWDAENHTVENDQNQLLRLSFSAPKSFSRQSGCMSASP